MTATHNNRSVKVAAGQASVERRDDGQLLVSGDLNFQTVPVIRQQSEALFANGATVVDLSGVERSNSAGLALLIEWMRVAQGNNRSITFRHLPAQLRDIARVCGVADKLPE